MLKIKMEIGNAMIVGEIKQTVIEIQIEREVISLY
jgi:hypothetical protein